VHSSPTCFFRVRWRGRPSASLLAPARAIAKHSAALASSGPQPEPVNFRQKEDTHLHRPKADDAQEQAAGQRYARSQDRLHTVFRNSLIGLKIISPDLVIRQANQALTTMLGLPIAQQVVDRKIMEFAYLDFV
jgi:PAS domain-containing protein